MRERVRDSSELNRMISLEAYLDVLELVVDLDAQLAVGLLGHDFFVLVGDGLDWSHDDSSSAGEYLNDLSLYVQGLTLFSLAAFARSVAEIFFSEVMNLLSSRASCSMESRVMPGRMVPSSMGVTSSFWFCLLIQ